MSNEYYLGTIIPYAGYSVPRGWASCYGTLIEISAHKSLFSLLDTTYGGDGRSTFELPDLRGRIPIGYDKEKEKEKNKLGEKRGRESASLALDQLPAHSHWAKVNHESDLEFNFNSDATSEAEPDAQFNADSTFYVSGARATDKSPGAGRRIGENSSSPLFVDSGASIPLASEMLKSTVTMETTPSVTTTVSMEITVPPTPLKIKIEDSGKKNPDPVNLMQPSLVIRYLICTDGVYPTPQ